jgi:hypothetical protein
VAHDYDKIDRFIDRMLAKLDHWIYGTPQNLGEWTPPVSPPQQRKEETPSNSPGKETSGPI